MDITKLYHVNDKIKFKYYSKINGLKYNKNGLILIGFIKSINFPTYIVDTPNIGNLKISHFQIIEKIKMK